MLGEETLKELKSRVRDEFSGYSELAGGKNYRYHHLVAVHKYAKRLMQKPEIQELEFDPEVVEVAALFHDIGRSEDIEDGWMDPFEGHKGHAERGKETVSGFVKDFVTEEQLGKVEKVIGNHHSEPDTVEGGIIQDADLLFKYGVQDLWRMFHYAAEKEREVTETWEYFREEMVDRLEEDLEKFHFDVARDAAAKRLEEHRKVINRIEEELEGEDI